ncbi:MAG: hypothetical protein ABEK50_10865 [bacterium]
MTLTYLDPTSQPDTGDANVSDRPESLEGLTIGLLDNGKTKADRLLELVAAELSDRHSNLTLETVGKPSPFKPAPNEKIESIASQFGAVITGIGD